MAAQSPAPGIAPWAMIKEISHVGEEAASVLTSDPGGFCITPENMHFRDRFLERSLVPPCNRLMFQGIL